MVEVEALEVEVEPGAAGDQVRLDHRARAGQPHERVVDEPPVVPRTTIRRARSGFHHWLSVKS